MESAAVESKSKSSIFKVLAPGFRWYIDRGMHPYSNFRNIGNQGIC